MSTLKTVVIAETTAKDEKQIAVKNSWLWRLLRWYRAAVLGGATEKEKAEWQKTAF